jgi:YVTN family beta-propeller protein
MVLESKGKSKDRNQQTTSKVADLVNNPFIGPVPFSRDELDQKRFFGRDYESEEIISLILGHRLVLIYAQSGAGKTSIINAKIAPELEKLGYEALPSARVSIRTGQSYKETEEVTNAYMLNVFQSLSTKKQIDSTSLLGKELAEFLNDNYPLSMDKSTGDPKPRVLIFDQLEELFTFYPNNKWREQQKKFFQQVAKALKNNRLLRIVFVIREDYLAELDPFLELLPERLRPRFRLERLRELNARLAIQKPLESLNPIMYNQLKKAVDGVISKIVDDLLMVKSIDPLTGNTQELRGEYVEPIHLQIVCEKWWREKLSREDTSKESIPNVDESLKQLYESSVHEAVNTKVSEEKIRNWCGKKLITPSGTRGFVHLTHKSSKDDDEIDPSVVHTFEKKRLIRSEWRSGALWYELASRVHLTHKSSKDDDEIDPSVVHTFEKKRLIRSEWRSGALWYELTHDRLIQPIKNSNERWQHEKNVAENRRYKKITYGSIILACAVTVAGLIFILHPVLPTGACTVGSSPMAVDFNPNTNTIYVANKGSDSVSVIQNIQDCKIGGVQNIVVGKDPVDVAVNPESNTIYVANSGNKTVSVIDGKTNAVVHTVQVSNDPAEVAVNPESNTIYVANSGNKTVSVIDGKTNAVVHTVPVGDSPAGVAVDSITGEVYVPNYQTNTVSVIDDKKNTVVQTVPVGDTPVAITINPSQNKIYVANLDSSFLSVIDGKSVKVTSDIPVTRSPKDIAFNPKTQ